MGMRRIDGQDADWDSLSFTASLKPEAMEDDGANSAGAVLSEIGIVFAVALGLAAAIDFILMFLNVRPFV
jgi:hypothetical protein